MDIFLKNKLLITVVIILAVFNVLTLATIWLVKFPGPPQAPPPRHEKQMGPADALDFISEEIKLDLGQREKYYEMRKKHFDGMKTLLEDIHSRKKAILELVSSDNPDTVLAKNLSDEIGNLQSSIETSIYRHFIEFSTMLNQEQKIEFRKLLADISEGKGRNQMIPPPPPDINR